MKLSHPKTLLTIAIGILLFISFTNLQSTSFPTLENGISPIPKVMKLPMKIYFIDPMTGLLIPENRTVSIQNNQLIESVIKAIQAGPKNKKLLSPLDELVRVESVTFEGKACYISLNRIFINNPVWNQQDKTLILTSIVNTLTELEQVQSVQFLIEGKPIGEVTDAVQLSAPLKRNESLIYSVKTQPIEVVIQFLNSIQTERYDVAYDLIDFKSKASFTYDEFARKMAAASTRYVGYERKVLFSQKFSNSLMVYIKYESTRKNIAGEYQSFTEYWEVVEEDQQYKVLLK